ncbi:ATP-dependent DNA helicase [Peptoniphilus vaginalis]|uniref:ATP-dependent DNA helicase n=1 Tax=Peptoniphilus vaginalis TaxID=1756987 RepID=UPI000A2702C5|nr:ATP-dependent RecD-like DNA helicase [Peptoniphilus vaginalis]
MPNIDDSIRKIDHVICRHLDNINGSSRGTISQDILEQLMKFINHIMLKFYGNGQDIPMNEENLVKAIEFAQVDSRINTLYKFRNFLQVVTTQFTLDEDGSERLMLKYYKYLLEAKTLLSKYYGIQILHNLNKFPLQLDSTLQEYYTKISKKIDQYPVSFSVKEKNRYYIQKIKPLFVNGKIYNEVTFIPTDDRKNKSKSSRVIAFTSLDIRSNYACKFHLIQESIEILGKTMPITIIDGWEISIRDCEFQNFMSLIKGKRWKVPYKEQRMICDYLTRSRFSLNELIDFPDTAYNKITKDWKNNLGSCTFIPVMDYCRNLIRSEKPGQNILRYLLYNMNNVIIKNQRDSEPNVHLSYLYLKNGCIQFDSLPFNRSPMGHNPKLSAVFSCIPHANRQSEIFARFIRNNTESKGKLFTSINDLTGFSDIFNHILNYNNSLWHGHKPQSNLMIENNYVFINGYKIDTCHIIEKLKELSSSGIENYSDDVKMWLLIYGYNIDCNEKREILHKIFSQSRVGVIYGSAGVGKSTFINHVSHFLNDEKKLYLTQTNPAKENLIRKIDAENKDFSTIASFLLQESSNTEYELLVIDECSTVSNRDMIRVLEKANFKRLLLVGDTYQIDAIQFGNWFSALKDFLPKTAVFELTKPHRTNDKYLLELWRKVRYMDENVKEVIERESYSLNVDESLLSYLDKDEAILCLNYDGLYGINNINRFLQKSNPNPAIQWGVQFYKVGDPILFLDSERFHPIIHNNMKGTIKGIEIIDQGELEERIQFDIEVPKVIDIFEAKWYDFDVIESSIEKEMSIIRFYVYKLKSEDEDNEDEASKTIVPFQIAYAVSIHKAQGLEYDSVKIVITDEVEELVTHNIFYTAITRARKRLKIYWTPEVEEKIISRIKPKDISKDVEILKTYLITSINRYINHKL